MCILLFFIISAAVAPAYSRNYDITTYTANVNWAGTGSGVFIVLYGENGKSNLMKLPSTTSNFRVGSVDKFTLSINDYGNIKKIKICQDWKGKIGPSWYLKKVTVAAERSLSTSTFIIDKWLENKKSKSICVISSAIEEAQRSCGKTPVNSRVINGHNSKPNQWKWQAQIRKLYFDGLKAANSHWCGGTLIHPQFVLTAAHCVYGVRKFQLTVALGKHDTSKDEATEQTFFIDQIFIHPSYSTGTKAYDIAIIKLNKAAILNSNIQLACLPDFNEKLPEGKKCMLTGWGKMSHPGRAATILQQAQLPVVSNTQCQKVNGHMASIKESMLCAGGNFKSGCHGDSGGPFVCTRSDGRYVVHGAVSWGSPTCKTTGSYTVLARVSHALEWIYSLTFSSYTNTYS